MTAFDTLAAAEAPEAAGMDRNLARACVSQMHAAASAGEPVTRPELDAAVAALDGRIAASERRRESLVWRLFGGAVALAGLADAALKYLP